MRDWGNFYGLAGTAGASLIGLLFVMISLRSQMPAERALIGIRIFLTPTLMYFCSVVFQSLVLLAPWSSTVPAGVILSLLGLAGLAHVVAVMANRRKFEVVLDGWQDWMAYSGLPLVANIGLIVGALGLIADTPGAFFCIAVATALFLAAGIYGAWDLTVWMITKRHNDGAS